MAIRRCIRRPRSYRGNVNPLGPRACYDEGKRCAETLFFDYHRQHKLRIKVARIFNTYGPRMHPNDGRVVSNFIVQALQGRGHHDLRRRHADPLLLLRRRPDRGLAAPDGHTPDDFTGPVNLGNPVEMPIKQLAEKVIELVGGKSKLVHARPLPVDDPLQRCPDITLARDKLKWEPKVAARAGAEEDDRVFRRPAEEQQRGQPGRALSLAGARAVQARSSSRGRAA